MVTARVSRAHRVPLERDVWVRDRAGLDHLPAGRFHVRGGLANQRISAHRRLLQFRQCQWCPGGLRLPQLAARQFGHRTINLLDGAGAFGFGRIEGRHTDRRRLRTGKIRRDCQRIRPASGFRLRLVGLGSFRRIQERDLYVAVL